jgi:hypothetical protein
MLEHTALPSDAFAVSNRSYCTVNVGAVASAALAPALVTNTFPSASMATTSGPLLRWLGVCVGGSLWKDADPGLPLLKQAKAEYAKLQYYALTFATGCPESTSTAAYYWDTSSRSFCRCSTSSSVSRAS